MDAQQKLINSMSLGLQPGWLTIGPHRIHFIRAGSGPPLLLLHGANIGWGAWYPNIKAFAKYFTVYALDLPGCGHSTEMDFRRCDFEKDFVEIIEQFIKIKQLSQVSIIGHSLGGWIALKLALRGNKIKHLILQSSLGFTDYIPWNFQALAFYPFAKLLTRTAMKPTKKNMKNFLQTVLAKSSQVSDEFVEYFHENVSKSETSHPFLFLQRLFGPLKLHPELNLKHELAKITRPVFVIAGDSDPLIPLHRLKKTLSLLPNAILEIFPSTGHVPSLEKSTEFNEKTLHFLNQS